MNCPRCGYEKTKVVDSRTSCESVMRDRVCEQCKYKYKTIEYELDLYLRTDAKKRVKKNG